MNKLAGADRFGLGYTPVAGKQVKTYTLVDGIAWAAGNTLAECA
jgi:hypothetical protein